MQSVSFANFTVIWYFVYLIFFFIIADITAAFASVPRLEYNYDFFIVLNEHHLYNSDKLPTLAYSRGST